VTLTAIPSNGYKFVNWSGDLEGDSSTLTFTVTKQLNLTAVFQEASSQQTIQGLFD